MNARSDLRDSAFLKAARGEPVPHTPVWFMRQAGRSLPEYLKVREGVGMLESCMNPELVVEITMQPVRRYGVDAAIFFSDIVLPLKAVGVDLDIKPGVGPVVARPVRTLADVDAIPDLTPEHVPFITEAVRGLVGAAREHAADRVRGRAVHGGVVPRRGRALEGAREDQGDDVRCPRRVGRADAQDRRDRGRLPRGAGRRRRERRTALRLLGRRAHARRLRGARDAALGAGARAGRGARRAPHPLRRRHLQPADADGRGRRRRRRCRLAYAARQRDPARRRPRRSRATSTRRWCSPPPT